jgi:hypothetical protein
MAVVGNGNGHDYVDQEKPKKKKSHIVLIVIVVLVLFPFLLSLLFAIITAVANAFTAVFTNAALRRHVIVLILAVIATVFGCPYLYRCYRREYMMEDPVFRMRHFDKKQMFTLQISKAQNYYDSVKLHRSQNKRQKITNDTVRNTYEEIYEKIDAQLDFISRYIEHFDYVAYQSPDQATLDAVNEALDRIDDLIDKLNRLDTINIKIENSALDNDTDRIRFLVEALEELNNEDH